MRPRNFALIACAVGVAVTLLLAWRADDSVELQVRDIELRLLPRHAATATAIVAIDEPSLREEGAWPWPRQKLADLVDRIASAGARGLVLDVILVDRRDGDDRLASAMRRLPSVVVAAVDDHGEWLLPSPQIRAAAVVAHGMFELDHDGIVRRLAATKQSNDRSLAALSMEAAAIVRPISIPVGRVLVPAFRTPPAEIPVVSAADVLLDSPATARLRGKVVFVGPTARALGDRVLTPASEQVTDAARDSGGTDLGPSPDPGVTVHAAAAESVIRGEEIHESPPLAGGVIAAIAAACILPARRSRLLRWVITASLAFAVTGGALLLLAQTGITMPLFILLLSTIAVSVSVEAAQVIATQTQNRDAAARIETNLGMPRPDGDAEVGRRLEDIAQAISRHREREAESKRILAHELKTPLASMRGLSQLLGGYSLTDAERQRVAALLEAEAGKLQAIVHALLDLERLPLRDFDSAATVLDLGELVRNRIEFLRASTDRDLRVAVALGISVRADSALIDRVVDNLVGNALKYTTAPAPVIVTVRQSNEQAVLEVEDRGPGIAESDRDRIFQRFFRGATAAGTEGLGLGLSFVAEIARWHGGSATVAAAPAGGSVFRLALPLAAAIVTQHAGGM